MITLSSIVTSPSFLLLAHEKNQEQAVVSHLSQFIAHFSQTYLKYPRPAILQVENLLMKNKWSNFVQLCHSINSSIFSSLKESEMNQFFLGEGICVGVVLRYFNQFFQKFSPLKASPLLVSSKPYTDVETNVKFYPFVIDRQVLEQETKTLHFLQAAYKIAYAFKKVKSLEFVPKQVLKNQNLEIVKRIPDLQSGKLSFNIQELIPELKKLASQSGNKGYLLGPSGSQHHAFALYLEAPFHFMDPSSGIATADCLEDLVLFLATYLTEKFPEAHSFALLEFASKFVEKPTVLQILRGKNLFLPV